MHEKDIQFVQEFMDTPSYSLHKKKDTTIISADYPDNNSTWLCRCIFTAVTHRSCTQGQHTCRIFQERIQDDHYKYSVFLRTVSGWNQLCAKGVSATSLKSSNRSFKRDPLCHIVRLPSIVPLPYPAIH